MEIHIWKGKGITIGLSKAQENAIVTILGLDVNNMDLSYSCYDDKTVLALSEQLEKIVINDKVTRGI